jgi:uncharacterized membrane protein YfcA
MTTGTAVAAFRRHSRLKHGEEKLSWIMLGGALLGVRAGAELVGYLASRGIIEVAGRSIPAVKFWIAVFYVITLTGVAVSMLLDTGYSAGADQPKSGPLSRIRIPPYVLLPASGRTMSLPVLAYLGLLLGFLSGVMGLGGGVIFMPILVYGIGMSLKMAAGTGVLLLVATSLAGTAAHAGLGHVHLGLAVVLLAGSTIAAPFGASITGIMSGARLRRVFALLVLLTAAAVSFDLVRTLKLI